MIEKDKEKVSRTVDLALKCHSKLCFSLVLIPGLFMI